MQWRVPGSVQSESAFSFIAVCRSYVHAQRKPLCSQAGQYLENHQSVEVRSWSVSVCSMKPSSYTPCMSAASVSWWGHGSKGWLCRHILPCASRRDFQCGKGRVSMHSYPIAHVGVFCELRAGTFGGLWLWLSLLFFKCFIDLFLTCLLWAIQKLY